MPDKVKVPAPAFTKLPLTPLIIPLNVELFVPVVKVPDPKVTLPDPINAAIVLLKLFKSNVAPLLTVTLVVLGNALVVPTCNVPLLTVVAPV